MACAWSSRPCWRPTSASGRQGLHGPGERAGVGAKGRLVARSQPAAGRHRPPGAGQNLMGPVDHSLHLRGDVTVLMLCGLQGSGKTTTCGKLGRLIQNEGGKPMLVAADLQRPAAIEQLQVLGQQLGMPVYAEQGATDPVGVCQDAVSTARGTGIRRGDPRHGRPAARRRGVDGPAAADRPPRAAGPGVPGGRRDDRPGRRQQRQGVQRGAGARRRDHDQARRRRPRRRGAVGQARHRRADQVHRHRRASRRLGGVPSRPHGRPHPGHGRRRSRWSSRPSRSSTRRRWHEQEERLRKGEFTLDDFKQMLGADGQARADEQDHEHDPRHGRDARR